MLNTQLENDHVNMLLNTLLALEQPGLSKKSTRKLPLIQKAAAKVLTRTRRTEPIYRQGKRGVTEVCPGRSQWMKHLPGYKYCQSVPDHQTGSSSWKSGRLTDSSADPHNSTRLNKMATENITIAAMGRPFGLGMLYDGRRDELIPGFTLWDDKMLKSKTTESTKPSSSFNISASDSIEARSNLLNVDASLQASFMSGLIEVSGSAKYMTDKKQFHNQSRVTCQYKATTVFKELSMIDFQTLDKEQKSIIKKGVATHVVTGILYGANAIYVFDSEKLESSNVQNIEGSMKAVIKKIPTLSLEGSVDIKLSQEEKSVTDKFSCKFYGDFILGSNPATFQDAVRTYVELPKLLGKGGENSVPLKVWLMPLKQLAPEAAVVKDGISSGLVRKIQQVIEDLRAAQMRCNDCQVDPVVQKFSQLQDDLTRFYTLISDYEFSLQELMAEKFPLIREGKEKESSVEKFLQDREKSPFSRANLEKWLNQKEREINVMSSCLGILTDSKFVRSESEMQRVLLDPDVEFLCFAFTSLGDADTGLDAMAKFLDSGEIMTVSEDLWYYSDGVIKKMRADAELVNELGKALNHRKDFASLVAAIDNSKRRGGSIYHFSGLYARSDAYVKMGFQRVDAIDRKIDVRYCKSNMISVTQKKRSSE
ncbi:uncharacterized protein V6R79_013999 [Siganus canaliculatus]